ncbi:hypothetical protein MG293_003603 [Ovis ammon polii]|uniref:Uncharacterized protein n=1 Tax=Ovis ammon polii TaxID=230172 RepID=A0AAD4YGK7_OVIAM|nr:hypothetical protein MG293_003603 [Ovis ammon polii]
MDIKDVTEVPRTMYQRRFLSITINRMNKAEGGERMKKTLLTQRLSSEKFRGKFLVAQEKTPHSIASRAHVQERSTVIKRRGKAPSSAFVRGASQQNRDADWTQRKWDVNRRGDEKGNPLQGGPRPGGSGQLLHRPSPRSQELYFIHIQALGQPELK